MTEKRNDRRERKRAGFISLLIFNTLKIMLINILAWFVLLIWFAGEALYCGQDTAINHTQKIITLNQDYTKFNLQLITDKLNVIFNYSTLVKNPVIKNTISLLQAVTQIYLSRFYIMLQMLPVFMLALFVAITDGLVKRDIRKFQGARESSFTFHRVKGLTGLCLFIPLFIFLSMPVAVNPLVILLPQAMALSVVTAITITYFKKYL